MVIINEVKSDRQLVTNGIPQGSVLRPVLFNIIIKDLDKGSSAPSFCRDTRLGGSTDLLKGRKESDWPELMVHIQLYVFW